MILHFTWSESNVLNSIIVKECRSALLNKCMVIYMSVIVPPGSTNLLSPLEGTQCLWFKYSLSIMYPTVCIFLLVTEMGMWLKSATAEYSWSFHSNCWERRALSAELARMCKAALAKKPSCHHKERGNLGKSWGSWNLMIILGPTDIWAFQSSALQARTSSLLV